MNDVFIIGTGDSLLNLNQDEINHINKCENIVVNSHLIFYELLKIKPKNWVYVDNDYKTDTMLKHTFERADKLEVNWFLGDTHIQRLDELNIKPKSNIIKFNSKYSNKSWADNFEDRPFWCSILGTALNLMTIQYPKSQIKIIGMDGAGGQHFYTNQIMNYDKDVQKYHTTSVNNFRHHNSVNWFKWGVPIMIKEVEKRESRIFHCNKNSIFTNENHEFYLENKHLKPNKFFNHKNILDE
jgi:hypothetical protein